ncbi:TIGR00300 family protein [Candidatus Nitrosocosmicus hydrocola]|uniref:ornithine cyclodeaminase n=1 Tax=Candidatus Nitrosocosmicus hydrocola TaxID=1826872 RepID=UPI000B14122E|nr:TIGR00300 family protein [Candidatus Nitrosocosmicus hydrocola]
MSSFEKEIEVRGHLVDSSILTRIFDKVMDMKGDFTVEEFTIGKKKEDHSYAKLVIKADTEFHLSEILENLFREGATSVSTDNVSCIKAPKDMVLPDDFYSTTNNSTQIYYDNTWISVEKMMMDKCIVLDPVLKRAECRTNREIKKGDLIVTGERGIKIVPQERPREGVDIFQFMSSSSSSERPSQQIAKKVAIDIVKTKLNSGKIIVVAGPVVVHSGASDILAKMIKLGLVDGILTGNALAVHDIENALLGTSLGMHVDDGTLAVRGHRNHMLVVNEVFKSGSIKSMVETGKLTKGIMYECVKADIPFVLCGSIRDDGPIPDVITDVVEAQMQYKSVLRDAKLVIMLSTMLHSIAVGNMLPASVKVIAIDINQPVVTKLLDRGTTQAIGVVTDIGSFLPIVMRNLENMLPKD